MRLFVTILSLFMATTASAHGISAVTEEASKEFEARLPKANAVSSDKGDPHRDQAEQKLRYVRAAIEAHLNTDWHEFDGIVDKLLARVENCLLPDPFCEKAVTGGFRQFDAVGGGMLPVQFLSAANSNLLEVFPHRCEASKKGFVIGVAMATESREFVLMTTTPDVSSACFVRAIG